MKLHAAKHVMPAETICEGRTIALQPVPMRPWLGAGSDGHIYNFKSRRPTREIIDYSIEPAREPRQRLPACRNWVIEMEDGTKLTAASLVCYAWHGEAPADNHNFVICLNADFDDLRPENLRWAPFSEYCKFLAERKMIRLKGYGNVIDSGPKLSEDQVRNIILHSRQLSADALCETYGIKSSSSLYRIVSGQLWYGVIKDEPLPPLPFPTTIAGHECRGIQGFPRHAVTRDGRVWKFRSAINTTDTAYGEYRQLRPWIRYGRPFVSLQYGRTHRGHLIGSLVLTAFGIPKPEKDFAGTQIVKGDDWSLDNLQWKKHVNGGRFLPGQRSGRWVRARPVNTGKTLRDPHLK